MKELKEILLEKLRINKDTEVDESTYVIFYGEKNNSFKKFKTIQDVAQFIKYNIKVNKGHCVFKVLNDELMKEFIHKWLNFSPISGEGEDVRKWAEENNIKEIKADEINKYLR